MQRRREKAGIWNIAQEALVVTRVRSYHRYPPVPTRSGLFPFTVFLLEVFFIFQLSHVYFSHDPLYPYKSLNQ